MFAFIFKVIKAIFKFIYKILSIFNLQFALLVALVGVILYITGVLSSNGASVLIFCIVFIASIVAAVIITVCKLFGSGKDKEDKKEKKKKDKSVQIVDEQSQNVENAPVQVNEEVNLETINKSNEQGNVCSTKQTYPKYYAVKQNKNYLMAEYSDRYELYLKTPNGLSKVRTDYK